MWEEWLQQWCDLLGLTLAPSALPDQIRCASNENCDWVIEKTDVQVVISLRFDTLGYQLEEVIYRLMGEVTPGRFAPLTLRYGYHDQLGLILMLCFALASDQPHDLRLGYDIFCELQQLIQASVTNYGN